MSKLIGLITAWGAEPFIEPAIKQGLEYCDELVVSVSANHPAFNKYADNTMEICQKYRNQIKLVEGISGTDHPSSKGSTMIKMLNDTNNNKKDNWIWILDADEFYFEDDLPKIREIIKEDYVKIEMPEKYFIINMSHYINLNRSRIKRIPVDNLRNIRTNMLGNEGGKTYVFDTEKGMHHYSFLLNPYFKKEFWEREYGNPNSGRVRNKIYWLNEIYMKMDLNNQQEAIEKSIKRFGIKTVMGPLFAEHREVTKENGELYEYNGKHPIFIEDAGLPKINDFRKIYYERNDKI